MANTTVACTNINLLKESQIPASPSQTELYAVELDGKPLDQGMISNCITHIPQDIKLELNNGTLTLKAGSKVYVPNGAGVFDAVTTTSDKSVDSYFNDTRFMFIVESGGIGWIPVSDCVSGQTDSKAGQPYHVWYDTTNNVVKLYSSSTSQFDKASLPICVYTSSSTQVTSIDQVFNGFGYIGSTVFALPGVKGLIPNGRNADGSLKSIEFTTNNVLTNTGFSGDLIEYGIINENSLYVYNASTTGIQSGKVWYEEKENKLYVGTNPDVYCIFANITSDGQTLKNALFKTTFHALGYNDKRTIVGWGMPDYEHPIVYQGSLSSGNNTITITKPSYVVVWTPQTSGTGHALIKTQSGNVIGSIDVEPSGQKKVYVCAFLSAGSYIFSTTGAGSYSAYPLKGVE